MATVAWPRNERGAVAGLKTTSYAENVVALAEAKRRGATEAVLPNTQGHLCEGTGSNVFYVVDGDLRTPTLASGCLAGVTRDLVLEWCGAREVDEPLEVVERASEVFLTSTTRDVQGVSRWDDRDLPAPGPSPGRRWPPGAAASTSCCTSRVRTPRPRCVRVCDRGLHRPQRAIGAVVARFVHTEEVAGSNPASPTVIRRSEAVLLQGSGSVCTRRARKHSWAAAPRRHLGS